jgi:hypothetical protein
MPSIWEIAGEALEAPLLAPLVIGGVVVSAIASPEFRQRLRRWGVQGMAAAMAAGDSARREMRTGTEGTSGLAAQIGHRLREAVAEVREDWEDFVAEARAERERRQPSSGTANGEQPASEHASNGAIHGMDEGSSGSAAMRGAEATQQRRARSGRRPRR